MLRTSFYLPFILIYSRIFIFENVFFVEAHDGDRRVVEKSQTVVRAPRRRRSVQIAADRRREQQRVGIFTGVEGPHESGAERFGTRRRTQDVRGGRSAGGEIVSYVRGFESGGKVLGRRMPMSQARPMAGRNEKSKFGKITERFGNRPGGTQGGNDFGEYHDEGTFAVIGKT